MLSLFLGCLRPFFPRRRTPERTEGIATDPADPPILPRWLSALHGAVTLTVLVLLALAALSLLVTLGLVTCSCWERVCRFLASY